MTRLAAYDSALTPDEIAALGGAGTTFSGNAPNASTYIRLSGTTAMSFPATEGFEYAGLLLTENIALAADCDWTGLGTIAFRDGAYIDLRGHKLDVNDFSAITSGGYLQMQNIEHVSTNVDFIVGSALKINSASSIHDYEAVFNDNYNLGSAALNVWSLPLEYRHDNHRAVRQQAYNSKAKRRVRDNAPYHWDNGHLARCGITEIPKLPFDLKQKNAKIRAWFGEGVFPDAMIS